MKQRHAILLSGFPRDYNKTIEEFNKNLRRQDNVDLFICFWDFKGIRKFEEDASLTIPGGNRQIVCRDKDAGLSNEEKIKIDYKPTVIKFFNLDEITNIIDPLSKIIEGTAVVPQGKRSHYHVTRTSLMFFMIYQTFLLMKQYESEMGFKYKNVVRARTDFVQGGFYPKVPWEKDFKDLFVGSWNWSGVGKFKINDHFAISNREIMEAYCSFFNNMHLVTEKFITNEYNSHGSNIKGKSKAWSPEHMLSIYLHEVGIKWKPIS